MHLAIDTKSLQALLVSPAAHSDRHDQPGSFKALVPTEAAMVDDVTVAFEYPGREPVDGVDGAPTARKVPRRMLSHTHQREAGHDKRLGAGVLRYLSAGANISLRDAAWFMEIVSDNTATDICLAAAGGVAALNATMRELGIDGIEMKGTALDWFRALGGRIDPGLSTMAPGEFARRGYPELGAADLADARARYHFETGKPFSLATPRAHGALLHLIFTKQCATPRSCDVVLEILGAQQLRDMMPRYIFGAKFAHKTGNFEPFIASDMGIATPLLGPPVVMCFLSQRHNGSRGAPEKCIGRMAAQVVLAAEARA